MKSAVFLYNTQSGKCKIGHCTDSICTVFRAYGYEITPQPTSKPIPSTATSRSA